MKIMKIRELREAAGLTQEQLAVQLGLGQATISAWEAEVYLPKARQLPLLARVVGREINDLFYPDADYAGQEETLKEGNHAEDEID